MTETLTIAQVTLSPTYIRGMIDEAHAERLQDTFLLHENRWPSTMPPIEVAPLNDKDPDHAKLIKKGFTHEILDGAHRYTGAARAGLKEVPANVNTIPPMDRFLFQVKANAGHSALPFSREARNRAVLYMVRIAKMTREAVGKVMMMHRSTVSRIASGETPLTHGKKGKKGKKGKRTGSVEFAHWLANGLAFIKAATSIKTFVAKVPEGATQIQTLIEGLEDYAG